MLYNILSIIVYYILLYILLIIQFYSFKKDKRLLDETNKLILLMKE